MLPVQGVYPLPSIDHCLTAHIGGKFFSTLDLSAGYHRFPMDPYCKDKTAFISIQDHQFNVMPFGMTNALNTFQRFMDAE